MNKDKNSAMNSDRENKNMNILSRNETVKPKLPIDFYKNKRKFSYIYQKAEKLVSAIYLLTSFFDEGEPLRIELRASAVRFLEDKLDLIQDVGTDNVETHERVRKNVLHISSLLQAGYYAGLISQMNYDVLRQEFTEILEKLSEEPAPGEQSALFTRAFFEVEQSTPEPGTPQTVEQPDKVYKTPSEPQVSRGVSNSERVSRAPASAPRAPSFHGQVSKVDAKKQERRAVIVGILRRKGKVSIKDISSELTGYSEKTVQRELGALVDEGVVKKAGERRWSRYSLADQTS